MRRLWAFIFVFCHLEPEGWLRDQYTRCANLVNEKHNYSLGSHSVNFARSLSMDLRIVFNHNPLEAVAEILVEVIEVGALGVLNDTVERLRGFDLRCRLWNGEVIDILHLQRFADNWLIPLST